MAGIDLNKYYQSLKNSGYDPVEAAQIVAYQYIDNPTGSIKQIKLPPKWYTEQDYYSYNAPDYLAAANYQGNDKALQAVSQFVQTENFTLPGISEFVRQNRSLFGDTDAYAQLKDLYDQKESARKGYEKQLNEHEFSKYGLPDPTIRYGVRERTVNGKRYIPYAPAVEYVNNKQKDYYTKLTASGLDPKLAAERTALYQQRLVDAVEKKIEDAGVNPFVEKVAELRKIKK